MIQDKLENKIHNVIMETAREPKLIVMHPQTWVRTRNEYGFLQSVKNLK
jgi:hypothetical protein